MPIGVRLLSIALLLAVVALMAVDAALPDSEYRAVVDFCKSMQAYDNPGFHGSTHWPTNCSAPLDPCGDQNWIFSCNSKGDSVTGISFSCDSRYNYFNGTFPASLGDLVGVTSLSGSDSYPPCFLVGGTIPDSIGNLTMLKTLSLLAPNLGGTLPKSLGLLDKLETLFLNSNSMVGTLPKEITALTKLKQLNLELGGLTGDIPSEISNLVLLTELSLQNNNFTGKVPESIGDMTNLTTLYLGYSSFDAAEFPVFITKLSNLQYLITESMNIIGTIPSNMGDISGLLWWWADGNQFTGSIPDSMSKMVNLSFIQLSNNKLNGTLPQWVLGQKAMEYAYLGGNQFSGSIPDNIPNTSALVEIRLDGNKLSGSIPSSLANAKYLEAFNASFNQLTGSIPDLTSLISLHYLSLGSNNLTGKIPAIGPYVFGLDLSNNPFLVGSLVLEHAYSACSVVGTGACYKVDDPFHNSSCLGKQCVFGSHTGHGNGEVLMLFSTRGLMMAFVLIAASIGTIAIAHWRITKDLKSIAEALQSAFAKFSLAIWVISLLVLTAFMFIEFAQVQPPSPPTFWQATTFIGRDIATVFICAAALLSSAMLIYAVGNFAVPKSFSSINEQSSLLVGAKA